MATTFNEIPVNSRILNNGGETTRNAHNVLAGANGQWTAGQPCSVTAGTIRRASATAEGPLTTAAGVPANAVLYIGLETQSTTASTTTKVAVQRITSETEFEGIFMNTTNATATGPPIPATAQLGFECELLQSTGGVFAVKQITATTGVGPVTLTGIESDFAPYDPNDANLNMYMHDTTDTSSSDFQRYHRVRFKFNGISDI